MAEHSNERAEVGVWTVRLSESTLSHMSGVKGESYSGGCIMPVVVIVIDGSCIGQEGGQIEERGDAVVHHHLELERRFQFHSKTTTLLALLLIGGHVLHGFLFTMLRFTCFFEMTILLSRSWAIVAFMCIVMFCRIQQRQNIVLYFYGVHTECDFIFGISL